MNSFEFIRALAARAGVSAQTVRRWEREGKIEPAMRAGPREPRYFKSGALERRFVADAARKEPTRG